MAKKQKVRKKKSYAKFLWALLVIVLFPVGFNIAGLTMQKRYTAEMRLMVSQSQVTSLAAPGPFFVNDESLIESRPRSVQTQIDALTGTTVLQAAYQLAADRLGSKMVRSDNPSQIYDDLVRRMGVDNEPLSDVISIKVTEDDPEVAAELANDVGLAYIENAKKEDQETAELMSSQLEEQTRPLQKKLKIIDAAISELKQKSGIYDINAVEANMGATKEADDRQLATAMASYEGGKAQLAVAEKEMKEIPEYINSGSVTQINPVLVTIQTALATENVNLAQLRAQYQENFPLVKEEEQKVAQLKSQLKDLKQSVPSQENRSLNPNYQNQEQLVAQLRAQVEAYAGQLAAAQREQQRSLSEVSKIPMAEQQLQALLRDRTTYEQTYEQLAQRQSAAITSMKNMKPPAEVVSPALPPYAASFPDKKLLSLTGIALGIFFAVLILMPRPEVVTEIEEPFVAPRPEPVVAEPAPALAVASVPARAPESHEDAPALNGESNSEPANGKARGGPQALARALKRAKTKPDAAPETGDAPALSESTSSA
jgi:uncharacterized protein involved in exopolysaccharide biosynthesis